MRLPIIKVRDNCTKREFVFTDSDTHDYLYADAEGIHYYNLQNGEGTGEYEDCGYSFTGEDGYMGTDIPMVDMIDIFKLYHEIKIKPLNDSGLDLDFDLIMGKFKVLDMRAEAKLEERAKEFYKLMQEKTTEFFGGDCDKEQHEKYIDRP